MGILKNWLGYYIRKVIREELAYRVLPISKMNNRPKVSFADESSVIYEPREISGGKKIYIGKQSRIGRYGWISAIEQYQNESYDSKIVISDNVNIGNYCCMTAIDLIQIGQGCLFSENVYISDHFHGMNPEIGMSPAEQGLFSKGPVIIGENCFVGLGSSILTGVELGKWCIVGANSVVTRSFPDFSMIAGSPAKLIKRYSTSSKEWIPVEK